MTDSKHNGLQEIVGIKGQIQTTYLAVYSDKLMLLDGACRSDVTKILTYITDTLKRPLSELQVVVVTHMHPDHAGGAHLLRKKTGCQIVSADKQSAWYKGVKGHLAFLNDILLTHYVAYRQGKKFTYLLYNPILKADISVSDGDRVPNFEDWTVFETPGHTDRDLSLWHSDSGQAYIGDLILKINNKFVSPYLIALPSTYKASLVKIKKLKLTSLLLAHGGVVAINDKDFDNVVNRVPTQPRRMSFLETVGLTQKISDFKQTDFKQMILRELDSRRSSVKDTKRERSYFKRGKRLTP